MRPCRNPVLASGCPAPGTGQIDMARRIRLRTAINCVCILAGAAFMSSPSVGCKGIRNAEGESRAASTDSKSSVGSDSGETETGSAVGASGGGSDGGGDFGFNACTIDTKTGEIRIVVEENEPLVYGRFFNAVLDGEIPTWLAESNGCWLGQIAPAQCEPKCPSVET